MAQEQEGQPRAAERPASAPDQDLKSHDIEELVHALDSMNVGLDNQPLTPTAASPQPASAMQIQQPTPLQAPASPAPSIGIINPHNSNGHGQILSHPNENEPTRDDGVFSDVLDSFPPLSEMLTAPTVSDSAVEASVAALTRSLSPDEPDALAISEVVAQPVAPSTPYPPSSIVGSGQTSAIPGPAPKSGQKTSPKEPENSQQLTEFVHDLLNLMALMPGTVQPHELALVADLLLRMLERIPTGSKIEIAKRISIMDKPPATLVSRLVLDANLEVGEPLIKKGTLVSDQDLHAIIEIGDLNKCKMIARRRLILPGIANALIETGHPSVLLELVRNSATTLPPAILQCLARLARTQPSLKAPLVTRADMVPQVAFDLFWTLPTELRRYVFTRFLTDSAVLERILKVIVAAEDGEENETVREDGVGATRKEQAFEAVGFIEQGMIKDAISLLSQLAGATQASVQRIITDPGGEPLAVIFKVIGISRSDFASAVKRWRQSPACVLGNDQDIEKLTSLFDLLSYNKAKVVLTYWDWLSGKSDPALAPQAEIPD